jgi:hypothetical protein
MRYPRKVSSYEISQVSLDDRFAAIGFGLWGGLVHVVPSRAG